MSLSVKSPPLYKFLALQPSLKVSNNPETFNVEAAETPAFKFIVSAPSFFMSLYEIYSPNAQPV